VAALERDHPPSATIPAVRWGILCLVGLLIAGFGGVVMLLGGYIGFGESMSKPAEGMPFIVAGAVVSIAGIALTVVAIVRVVKAVSAHHRGSS
jgi:TRAP-type C4-dicarboxylate transport system permease small subunit